MRNDFNNLVELLKHIVKTCPGRVAIRDCRQSYTYRELYDRAGHLAIMLLNRDIQVGARIICISKKDTESLVCFWGIMLAGGIPVMLDEEDNIHANERKIKEVRPAAIILDKKQPIPLTQHEILLFDFEELISEELPLPVTDQLTSIAYPGICYILLTSGTTGNPKAVLISHANVLHYTFSIYEKIGSPPKVNAVHASTFAADLGLTNLLIALASGGMLRILNKTESTDPELFKKILEEDNISLLKITPSHLLSLVAYNESSLQRPLDNIILGGEKLSWEAVSTIFSLGICHQLYNHYGPTETTIGAIAYKIDPSSPHFNKTGSVPLGAPLGQGSCFVNDPIDNIGELYITGPGVSVGYFENEVENKHKFSYKKIEGREILCYHTGDICRDLGDGNFEFLYRTDRQVKIKGYRIELGEIEMAIAAHPGVENVYVLTSANGHHQYLEAYIKPKKDGELTPEILRNWLSDKVSTYKVPSFFHFYIKAPYNANGKIDLEALRKKFTAGKDVSYPALDVLNDEAWAAQVIFNWKRVLNRDKVSASDHFFETGGDSLLAIQLVGRLQRNRFKVQISDLNNHPVLEDFIRLEAARRTNEEEKLADKVQVNRLTFSQYRFLHQQEFNLDNYCQAILLETESSIRVREMAMALNFVLESHLQLSAAFRKNNIANNNEKTSQGINLGTTILGKRYPSALKIQETCNALLDEISIEHGKLFTAHVFADPGNKDYLFLGCHHLAVDVISWHIIIEELLDNYELVLNNIHSQLTMENSMNLFFQELGQIKIPPSKQWVPPMIHRLPVQENAEQPVELTGVYNLVIPGNICEALCKEEERLASMANAHLLSAFTNGILKEFGIPKITIDLEFHGRPHHRQLPDISRSVSWWSTTVPLTLEQNRLSPKYCSELVDAEKAWANNINLHCDEFPSLSTERPDIRFNYLGHFPEQFGNTAIQMKPAVFNIGPTRSTKAHQEYKLYFTARFIGTDLIIDIQYQPAFIPVASVENVIKIFFSRLKHNLGREKHHVKPVKLRALEGHIPSVGQPLYNIKLHSDTRSLNKKNVFLTGATGFLGSHLLKECLKDSNVTLHCLVRGDNQQHAENRLKSAYQYYFKEALPAKSNVKIIKGDLMLPDFGIPRAACRKLEEEMDIILHAAADINLAKDYLKLLQTNLTPVNRIIELAQSKKNKPVHFVSTLAVSGYPADGMPRAFSENDFEYGQLFISDYERSKFEAEKTIRTFFQEKGTGKIYRVGHIAAGSANGKFQRNIEQNRIFQVIKGILVTRQIPENYNEKLSFSFVDIVAKGITQIVLGNIYSDMQCMHIENPYYLSFLTVAEMLRQHGYEIEVVDMGTFKKTVEIFKGTIGEKKEIDLMNNWIQRAIEFPRKINYVSSSSLDILAGGGLYFPRVNPEWFSAMMKEGIRTGYFHTPSALRSPSPQLLNAEVI